MAIAWLILGTGFFGAIDSGCQDHGAAATPASPGQPPATLPDKFQPPTTAPSAAMMKPVAMMPPADAPKPIPPADLTHVIAKDEPYYLSMPSGSEPPVGLIRAGTKALLLVPGTKYSKVTTAGGITAYTVTDGLEPISKK
jgi:hypothetical protein